MYHAVKKNIIAVGNRGDSHGNPSLRCLVREQCYSTGTTLALLLDDRHNIVSLSSES